MYTSFFYQEAVISETSTSTQIAPSEKIAENKSFISEAISSTIKGFVRSEREKLSEILSLMLSRRMVSLDTIARLEEFCGRSEDSQRIFFRILSGFSQKEVELLLDQIYGATDSPMWGVTLAEKLEKELLSQEHYSADELAKIESLREVLRTYLGAIFNYQYLRTRIYNSDNTPITILKYIAKAEGVHPASHWSAFEERFSSGDRILIGLEHFKIPNTPVVYVEVALSVGLIRKIDLILGEKRLHVDAKRADTAIFYSVNNTFPGLSGAGLGERVILRAKQYLKDTYPNVKEFATLSPIPSLRKYLEEIVFGDRNGCVLTKEALNQKSKNEFFPRAAVVEIMSLLKLPNPYENDDDLAPAVLKILKGKGWLKNPAVVKKFEKILVGLARAFLVHERRVDREEGKILTNVFDPVANFHLSNGAFVGGINYLGNTSKAGLERSYGMMVNYIYDDAKLEKNRLQYSQGLVYCRG